MTTATKPAVQSKSMIGSITSLIAVITTYVSAKTKLPPEVVDQILTPILVAGAGNILAIIGTFLREKKISGIFS